MLGNGAVLSGECSMSQGQQAEQVDRSVSAILEALSTTAAGYWNKPVVRRSSYFDRSRRCTEAQGARGSSTVWRDGPSPSNDHPATDRDV